MASTSAAPTKALAAAMDAPVKKTREDRRREKDLEEARKAGNAAPEYDEEGNAINPHIPQFMAKAPWYMDTGKIGLQHQKSRRAAYNADASKLDEQLQRGVKVQGSDRYRKGACTNCGAMTHKAADCLERPRKKGAKWTNTNIAPDEYLLGSKASDWEGKRDRWDGYDPASHKQVVEEYAALEAARQKVREEQLDKGTDLKEVKKLAKAGKSGKKKKVHDDDFGSSDESNDEDEDKYADAADQAGQKMDVKTRMTVRNLRIREDRAKYLMNLDVDSAHYDPKTRSMREAPREDIAPEDAAFAGENFTRGSGSVSDIQRLQLFAWQSEQRGHDVHINANPTQGELLHKEFLKKKDQLKETSKVGILDRYGGEEHLERVPRELLGGQTENYVEYSRTGQVIKGQERAKAKSKYDEDVYPGNHKSVWGSWYDSSTSTWGFACCHAVSKGAYCTGSAGIAALAASDLTATAPVAITNGSSNGGGMTMLEQMQARINAKAAEAAKELRGGKKASRHPEEEESAEVVEVDLEEGRKERDRERESRKRMGDRDGEVGELDRGRLEEARKREKRRRLEGGENLEKDRYDVTEEDMEAHRMAREHYEDPMANLKDGELLPL